MTNATLVLGDYSCNSNLFDDGLFSYYSFEIDGTDNTGHGYDASGSATHNSSGCIIDGCYMFNNQHLSAGDASDFKWMHGALDTTNFESSVSFWYKFDNNDPNSFNYLLGTGEGSSSTIWYHIGIDDRSPSNMALALGIARGVVNTWVASPYLNNAAPDDTEWHHVVVTYNQSLSSDNAVVYVDGSYSFSGSKDQPPSTANSWYGLYFGRSGAGTYPFIGRMDEIGIWNKTLKASEVAALYNSGNGLTYCTLVTNPRMDVNTTQVWSYSGEFEGPETVEDFNDEINTYLFNCVPDVNGTCLVPLVFSSESAGVLNISNISIKYTNPNPFVSRTVIQCNGTTTHDCRAESSITSIDSIEADNYLPNPGQTIHITINWTGWHYGDENHWAFFIDNLTAPISNCTTQETKDLDPSYYSMECDVTIPSGTSAGNHTITVTGDDYLGYCEPGENGVDVQDSIMITINGPPTAVIESPADGSSFKQSVAISFIANVIDPNEILTGDALQWYSDVDGYLGFGETIIVSSLSVGQHTITLNATDSGGLSDTYSIIIDITGTAIGDRVSIPCTGSAIHDCRAENSITSIDSLEVSNAFPNAGDTIEVTVNWTGWHYGDDNHWAFFLGELGIPVSPIGTCKSFRNDLDPSYYSMSCNVTIPYNASSGLQPLYVTGNDYLGYCNPMEIGTDAEDTINVTVNTPPTIVITSPEDNSLFAPGAMITFAGIVNDIEDPENTLAIQWASDISGILDVTSADPAGNVAFSTNSLSPGYHTITLEATDSQALTGVDTINVNITCIVPTDNMTISADTKLCAGTYNLAEGIVINESNVLLDCSQAEIIGSGYGIGVYVSGDYNISYWEEKTNSWSNLSAITGNMTGFLDSIDFIENITIKNCRIDGFNQGMNLTGVRNLVLEDNTLLNNDAGLVIGAYEGYAAYNEIYQGYYGIAGALLNYSLDNNEVHDNADSGIFAALLNSNVSNNEAYNNKNGITSTAFDSRIFGNTVYNNPDQGGIVLLFTNNTKVYENTAHDNGKGGIIMFEGSNNEFSNNTLYNNKHGFGMQGLFTEGYSVNNLIADNDIYNNTRAGIGLHDGTIWGIFNIISNQMIGQTGRIRRHHVVNNTIVNNKINNTGTWDLNVYGGAAEDNEIYANDFYGMGVKDSPDHNIYCVMGIGNNYYGGATGPECPIYPEFTVSGTVTGQGVPLVGANVSIEGIPPETPLGNTLTDSDGNYSIPVFDDSYALYQISAEASGYLSDSWVGPISGDFIKDFDLIAIDTITVSGFVTDVLGPLDGATVKFYIAETLVKMVTTNGSGYYETTLGDGVTYTVEALHVGHESSFLNITTSGSDILLNFTLPVVCTDDDGDEFAVEGLTCGPIDCDDTNASINPGAVEICNGIDDDCEGGIDEGGVCAEPCDYGVNSDFSLDNFDNWCDDSSGPGLGSGVWSVSSGEARFNSLAGINYYMKKYQTYQINDISDLNVDINWRWKQDNIESNYGNAYISINLYNSSGDSIGWIVRRHAATTFYTCTNTSIHNCEVEYGSSFPWEVDNIDLAEVIASLSGVNASQISSLGIRFISYNNAATGADAFWDYLEIVPYSACQDFDNDTYQNIACGGTDCDDTDPNVNPGESEICNGIDDDCSTFVDDGLIAPPNSNQVGECVGSVQTCFGVSGWGDDYSGIPTYEPEPETMCDMLDNDCDGVVDENLKSIFYHDWDGDTFGDPVDFTGLLCAAPPNYVDNGTDCDDTNDQQFPGNVETCNGLNSDCNIATPDGSDEVWYGQVTSCGIGVCAATGVFTCTAGMQVDTCISGPPTGADDDCNGLDDDCSGVADDNYVPPPTICGVGVCVAVGLDICVAGSIVDTCVVGPPTGADDDCNGLDDDCNGLPDDNYVPDNSCFLPGECAAGNVISSCAAGVETTCQTGTPVPETCDNSDEDCDGAIDNGLNQPTICGVGACAGNVGIETCTLGVWGGDTCDPFAGAVAETCDNSDEDCDGAIDNGVTQPTTCGVGACAGNVGIETCIAGVFSGDTCDPFAGATAETCDGTDEDCNGVPDNDLTPPPNSNQQGVCAGSFMTCFGVSGWIDDYTGIPTWEPEPEVSCDSLDNDCDGSVDEGLLATFYEDFDLDTYGNLFVTTDTCSPPGGYVFDNTDCDDTNASINPGETEICGNGIDDNCVNGIDEGCGGYVVSGTVTGEGIPLSGATVSVLGIPGDIPLGNIITDSSGNYMISVVEIYPLYTIKVDPFGPYAGNSWTAPITGDITQDFDLVYMATVDINGIVIDENVNPIPGATVSFYIGLSLVKEVLTNSTGFYETTLGDNMTYYTEVSKTGYYSSGRNITTQGLNIEEGFQLQTITECSDGIDNDGDIFIDAFDPGCYDQGFYDPNDDDETDSLPECSDFFDNDGDFLIDYPADPECTSTADGNETIV
ncbi:MopE-related protein [Thermoproteota archaeon]